MLKSRVFLFSTKFAFAQLLLGLSVGAAPMDPPVITEQPQPQTAFVGANVHLHVTATPSQPLWYRWRFHGTNLPNNIQGQSTPFLTLREVTAAASGPYSVAVNQPIGGAVGYVNLDAVPGYSLFAVPLVQYGTNQTVPQQIPFAVDGASLFKLDGNGFIANNFLDGWSDTDMILTLGEGWFLHNPGTDPFRFTLVGGVMQGSVTNSLPAGHAMCANIIPQTGRLTSDFANRMPSKNTLLFIFGERVTLFHQLGQLRRDSVGPDLVALAREMEEVGHDCL